MPDLADRRVVRVVLLSVVAVAAIAAGVYLFLHRIAGPGTEGAHGAPAAEKKTLYHCPMHPTMVADRPGDCPICGMRMVPIEEAAESPSPAPEEPPGGPAVEGLAAVSIPTRKQQLIGVRTEEVRTIPFVRKIRAVGRVTADETRLHHVHTKIEGWVEVLHVNATGVKVEKGQPLLAIYSPELVATQEEYLLALRARQAAGAETLPQLARTGDELVESAGRRLLLFDLRPAQIEELERTGRPSRTVTLHAPISGYVTQRNVTQGEKIGPDTTLLDIADLSRVWVIASVYEYELPFVRVGQAATVTLSYLPGRTFRGRSTLVYPTIEGTTRTAQVRLEFDNPDLALKPEMYAEVEIESRLGERLAVPDSAVLSSGTRNIVFVARGDGYFEPREVRLGLRLPDAVEILEGLSEGERVVASGTFFVDSESKLKAALKAAGASKAQPEHQH
jgi:Cu(I)/Ag(I) efflux system membrane fusion protein